MMRILRTALALSGLAVAVVGAQTQPSATDLVQRIQAHFDTVKDFRTDYTGTHKGGVLQQTSSTRGTLLVKKPGRMRWTCTGPDKSEVVADGTTLYTHLVADKQVFVSPLPRSAEASSAQLFLLGLGNMVRDFTAKLPENQPPSRWQVDLKPRKPDADFNTITLVVDRTTLALAGLTTTDENGGSSAFAFTHYRENVGLADADFVFKVPPGAEVIKK